MKHILLTTIAAVLVVGCGESQQSAPSPESKPAAEAATPEPPPKPPTAKAPDISIHDAAKKGNIEAVKQHLAAGADVNTKGGWLEVTPLYYAAGEGHKETAELLIAKGADVNAKDNFDTTPLDYAVTAGKEEMADLLRKNGGRSAAYDSIHLAAMLGNIEAVEQHLADGADVDAKDEDGETSLHRAAKFGHKEIAELLISNGADVNAKSEGYESTPLHHAAWAGYAHKEVTELLIAKGADVNAKNNIGITPLDAAITRSHTEIADLLRKHGGKTGQELKVIVESYEVLRVSCGPRGNTYMPFTSWQIGGKEPIGYDPDLIKLIAKEIGVVVKFIDAQSLFNKWRETAVDPRLSVLSEDIADVSLYAITINNERKKLVDFSEPYFTDGLSILVKRESGILSLNELKGKKILAPSNTVAYPWTKKNLTQSIIVSEITNFIPNDLILKGTVDAYIADRVNSLAISSKDNRLVVLPRRLTTDHLGIAVKKGNTELLGKINTALIKFKENGALKELEAKWF